MLAVKTYLAASAIHGVGVFAAEHIPKGQVVWYFDHRIDKLFDIKELVTLPSPFQQFLLSHGFVWNRFRMFVLCGDNAKYFNHSNTPNVDASRDSCIALRDIQAGEEITEDYRVFDDRDSLFGGTHALKMQTFIRGGLNEAPTSQEAAERVPPLRRES